MSQRFTPPRPSAWTWITGAIWAARGVAGGGLALGAVYLTLRGGYDPEGMTQLQARLAMLLALLAGRHGWIAYFLTYVSLALWAYLLYDRDLPIEEERDPLTPARAFSYFAIPLLNLYQPYQVIRERWLSLAQENLLDRDGRYFSPLTPAWLPWWWGAIVVTSVAGYGLALVISDPGIAFPKLTPDHQGLLAATGLTLALNSVLWLLIIWLLERRRRAYWLRVLYARAN